MSVGKKSESCKVITMKMVLGRCNLAKDGSITTMIDLTVIYQDVDLS